MAHSRLMTSKNCLFLTRYIGNLVLANFKEGTVTEFEWNVLHHIMADGCPQTDRCGPEAACYHMAPICFLTFVSPNSHSEILCSGHTSKPCALLTIFKVSYLSSCAHKLWSHLKHSTTQIPSVLSTFLNATHLSLLNRSASYCLPVTGKAPPRVAEVRPLRTLCFTRT